MFPISDKHLKSFVSCILTNQNFGASRQNDKSAVLYQHDFFKRINLKDYVSMNRYLKEIIEGNIKQKVIK